MFEPRASLSDYPVARFLVKPLSGEIASFCLNNVFLRILFTRAIHLGTEAEITDV